MSKDPSKIRWCPECRCLVAASTMRPLSRTCAGSAVRVVCVDCFTRVMASWKTVRDARAV